MTQRLRADFFAAALLRRAESAGAFAVLRRRGAAEAGTIFVKIDRLDGTGALFQPVPQSEARDDGVRLFQRAHKTQWSDVADIEARLAREINFDPDLWIVEIEDRAGRDFLERNDEA